MQELRELKQYVLDNFQNTKDKNLKKILRHIDKLIKKKIVQQTTKEAKSMVYNKQGHCPFCNSENISYDSLEIMGDMIYYPAMCEDCKKTFKEYYTLNFIEVTE